MTPAVSAALPVVPARWNSVDALRGLTVAAMLLVNTPGDWAHVYAPLRHADWHGCTPTDLVFPMFLFIVGVSVALAMRPAGAIDTEPHALARAALWRAARLVAMGLFLHAMAWWWLDLPWFRPWGVLQRIGLCYAVVALLAIHAGARAQWWVVASLLAVYGALLAAGESLAPGLNIASRIDAAMLGPHLYQFDPATGLGHDPEGLASTLPAIATTVLGLRCGDWLRQGRHLRLLVAAAVALALGAAWATMQPLNKNLWTPSFVLWSAGWSMAALALAHVLVDRRGWPPLGLTLGRNAIVVYAGSALMVYGLTALQAWEPVYRLGFARWLLPLAGPEAGSLAFALAFVGFWWLVAAAMHRRGWHWRI